eukprot:7362043-Prymnesium_polylepis.1
MAHHHRGPVCAWQRGGTALRHQRGIPSEETAAAETSHGCKAKGADCSARATSAVQRCQLLEQVVDSQQHAAQQAPAL